MRIPKLIMVLNMRSYLPLLRAPVLAILFAFPATAFSQPSLDNALLVSSPGTIAANEELENYMNRLAEDAISGHCASCHGEDLTGQHGIPDLTDYDWLWAIDGYELTSTEVVMEIMQTILYGIRDTDCPEETKSYGACPDTRYSEMPSYDEQGFSASRINDYTEYVLYLSGREADERAVTRAAADWDICAECHAEDAFGYKPYGGPNLTDDVWLFGGSREEIHDVIVNGAMGYCPPWSGILDAVTIKALSVYIYNLSY